MRFRESPQRGNSNVLAELILLSLELFIAVCFLIGALIQVCMPTTVGDRAHWSAHPDWMQATRQPTVFFITFISL